LGDFLSAAGHDVTIQEDPSILSQSSEMSAYDALVINTRRENQPDIGNLTLSEAEQEGLKALIRSGKRCVCHHISTAVPTTWPEFHEITGGGWITGSSFHPPYGEFTVNISAPDHPAVSNMSDFTINDELYMGLALQDGNNVFITAEAPQGTHPWGPARTPTHMPAGTFPLGWTRQYGAGNVFTLLLGHDARSFQTPGFQQLVLNGVDWVAAT
jgi:type 1 glutamine amidotransferase